MIVPSVFIFSGGDESALNAGAGLMFITLPKVFASMPFGTVLGTVFFILVFFAAVTSSISLMETIVSIFMDKFKWSRKFTCILVAVYSLLMPIVAVLTCVFVGFVIKPQAIIDEVEASDNGAFKSKKMFTVMIKWIAPIFLIAILISSILNAFGIITM